jgi:hypothetical protein
VEQELCMYLVLLCIFGKKLMRACVLLLYKNRIQIKFSYLILSYLIYCLSVVNLRLMITSGFFNWLSFSIMCSVLLHPFSSGLSFIFVLFMLHLLTVCALYVWLCDYVNICMYLVLLCIFGKKLMRACVDIGSWI